MKKLMIGILSLVIMGATTSVFATDSVLETGNTTSGDTSTATEITSSEYENASTIPTDTNTSATTDTNNTITSTGTSTDSLYNTVDEEDEEDDKMPQTGIEDSYIGILLIGCVAISIFTYKKMKDYKNV